jgi:flagellar basal-body rod protein FlgB
LEITAIEIGLALAVPGSVGIDLGSIDSLQATLTYHRERHTVLAGNVANLDTPGFKPKDLVRAPSGAPGELATTSSGHIAASTGGDLIASTVDTSGTQGPDGNAVSLERELAKIDANRTRYATSAELVSRRLALLRYAAGDGT